MNHGLQIFIKALLRTLSESPLRTWYKKVLLRTLIVALLLVLTLGAGIVYAVGSLFEGWASVAAGTLAFISLCFISGWLGILLVNFFVQFLGKERQLFQILIRSAIAIPESLSRRGPHSSPVLRFVASLLLSIGAIPLLVFPLTIPLAVVVYAWVFASDALAGADSPMPSHAVRIGMGFVPAACSLFPLLGWALLPVLQVAAQIYKLETSNP